MNAYTEFVLFLAYVADQTDLHDDEINQKAERLADKLDEEDVSEEQLDDFVEELREADQDDLLDMIAFIYGAIFEPEVADE